MKSYNPSKFALLFIVMNSLLSGCGSKSSSDSATNGAEGSQQSAYKAIGNASASLSNNGTTLKSYTINSGLNGDVLCTRIKEIDGNISSNIKLATYDNNGIDLRINLKDLNFPEMNISLDGTNSLMAYYQNKYLLDRSSNSCILDLRNESGIISGKIDCERFLDDGPASMQLRIQSNFKCSVK